MNYQPGSLQGVDIRAEIERLRKERNAALRDVARSFALPLRAAGIEASVAARFVGPDGRETASVLDRPLRIEDRIRARNP